MTDRLRVILAASALAVVGYSFAPTTAHADSRRHVFKPGDQAANVARGITSDGGLTADGFEAPEIDGQSLALGLALAAGGLAMLTSRRRRARA